jgi:hypothetical protein
MKIGFAPVSKPHKKLELQTDALNASGGEQILTGYFTKTSWPNFAGTWKAGCLVRVGCQAR